MAKKFKNVQDMVKLFKKETFTVSETGGRQFEDQSREEEGRERAWHCFFREARLNTDFHRLFNRHENCSNFDQKVS